MSAPAVIITPLSGGSSIVFDAVVTNTRTKDVDVTEHPVESGSNIADHVRPKAEEVRIDAVISDFPLPGTHAGLAYGRGQDGRAQDLYAKLEVYRDAGTTLTIVTRGKAYRNMVIEAMQRTDSAQGADAIRFTMTCKEIRVVASQVVPLAKPKINAAKAKANLGKQPGTKTNPAMLRQSTLAKLVDKFDLDTPIKKALSTSFGSH